jgi:Putative adhesin
MNRQRILPLMLVAAFSVASYESVGARQDWSSEDWCRDQSWGDDRQGVCEVRQHTLMAGAGTISVDAAPNGGIQVQGGPRADILVLARVVATAETEQRAREIASGVQIDAAADRVSATGPTGLGRREGWHVSYRLAVPTQTSLSLKSSNGGLSVTNVEGRVDLRTVNGGIRLSGLAGEVTGRTSNGGVDVDLDGASWTGAGLDVETSNGGVRLRIPEQYSARLEASTDNGGLQVDFPVTVQGRRNREIATNIGAGGPLIRVRTSNGGIRLLKK